MAFQTSILRDGEWVTQTVNLQAALKASATPKAAATSHPDPPSCGILSRTIVESPIVHWILPARLRSEAHNDIAFIGDHFVQISELRRDGQVHEVARKSDFRFRIRGAAVIGDSLQHGLDDEDPANTVKSEDEDTLMQDPFEPGDAAQVQTPPPQLLVLILESGDTVYVCLRRNQDSTLDFVVNKHESPKNLAYLGYHLSVDPSSRYMAAASPDGILVMYELRSMQDIHEKYRLQGSLEPVKSTRIRAIQGVIHKLEFLYPRPEDDYHIILLLIVTRKDRTSAEPVSRMVTYEWEVGDSLKDIFAEEKVGNRLPKEHRMPSLLIPLRFNTAFFAVSQPDIGIVKNCLSGAAVFEVLETDTPGRTDLHHGQGKPLWTAWSRPFRRKKYFEKTDIIYLAREDGAIIHVEIDAPELVPSVTNVGCLDTNINTAFTTAYDVFTDVLIIGGDSGPGGIWKLAPRTDLERVGVLPNWSPVVDVATSSWRSSRSSLPEPNRSFLKPDSLFSASGRGRKGNLTQWRWGIQGRIGLDIDSGEPIKRSWGFSMDGGPGSNGLYGLLALPNASIVLQFSKDFAQVDLLEADNTGFDLASRTLDAYQTDSGPIVQVTEKSISLLSASHNTLHSLDEILHMGDISAENAFCGNDVVALTTTSSSSASQIHTINVNGMEISLLKSWHVPGEVTCVSVLGIAGNQFVIAGSVVDGTSWISAYSLDGKVIVTQALDRKTSFAEGQSLQESAGGLHAFEPLTSICAVEAGVNTLTFVAGTRCGHMLTVRICHQQCQLISWISEVMGVAPVDVFPVQGSFDGGAAAMVCADNNLVMMSQFSDAKFRFKSKNFIWLTDSNDSSMSSPQVHSAFSLGLSLSEYAGHASIMLLAGSKILFADIWPHYSLVPRCLPLNGTPTRIIFSHAWNCLVVGMLLDDKPTLAFVDPESGCHIATASDKNKNASQFVSGLGHPGDRIYGLSEWLYVKDGKTFAFLLVGTKDGRLLIISVKKLESRDGDAAQTQMQYWTRYKKLFGKPIYSIVGDEDGIIFCADKTIYWDVLDLMEKKLKQMKQYALDSPATSLRVSHGKIFALTTMHSLEIIDHKKGSEDDMVLRHTDKISRTTVHMIDIGTDNKDLSDSQWPVTMLSDHRGGIAGVWVPRSHQNREFDIIFEGSLPTSVRRFAYATSRPPWLRCEQQARYGVIASEDGGADVFGVSLDGSLRHFTLLSEELWRFLSLIQNLAQRISHLTPPESSSSDSESMNSDEGLDVEPRLHPRLMHINGDVLSQCLEHRLLRRIVGKGYGLDLFREYLDGLERGRWTEDFRDGIGHSEEERQDAYFRLGYDVLDHLLAPVL